MRARPTKNLRTAAPFAIMMLSLAGTASGQEIPSLLERIHEGDWIVHTDIISREAQLYGLVLGLSQGIEHHCPGYRVPDEEGIFRRGLVWLHFGMQDLARSERDPRRWVEETLQEGAVSRFFADEATVLRYAQAGAPVGDRLASNGCATGTAAHRIASNAARLLAGRRPAFGGPDGATLSEELTESIRLRHMYDEYYLIADVRVKELFEDHYNLAAGAGVRTLVCRYDVDPARTTYVEQFYWGPGAAAYLVASGFSLVILPAFQKQLVDIVGPRVGIRGRMRPTTHPFLTLGPPRQECPSKPDPQLPESEFAKPRSAIVVPEVHAPENPEPIRVRDDGIEYGPVPEDWVPPKHFDRECGGRFHTCWIAMEKQSTGALIQVQWSAAYPRYMWLGRDFERRGLPPALARDFNRARGEECRTYDNDYDEWRDCTETGEAFRFLRCRYNHEEHGLADERYFWADAAPRWATREYLRSQHPQHPLLRFGPATDMCPATLSEADAMGASPP